MGEFDVDITPIYVFEVDDEYLFAEYFDHTDLFERLADYYVQENYRFEVPVDEFDDVRETLEDFYYKPEVVDEPAEFCVVQPKYDEYATILKRSVVNWERDGHRFFLMQSPLAVDEAVERGATRLEDTEFVLGL